MNIDLGGKATGPLAGVRVLDLSTVVSGPICTQILGDFGADVIKVETPGGDISRRLGGVGPPTVSGLFAQLNRNKRSVVLDLKNDAGREALYALARTADVVMENFRPGVADRLRIGYEDLSKVNDKLIYLAISGYGTSGPYTQQPAYDMVIQGMGGLAKILGNQEQPKLISNLIADKTSGVTAAYSLMAALFVRERSDGRGQRVDVPMIDSFASFILADVYAAYTFGEEPQFISERDGYKPRRTQDGHVALLIIEPHHYDAICRTVGRDDLIADPRYATLNARLEKGMEFDDIIDVEIAKFTTSELIKRAHKFGAPMGPVYGIDEFLADPQVQHNETVFLLEDLEHPMTALRSPSRYSRTPTNVRHKPPQLGEHTAEVLREAGLSETQITALTPSS